MGEKTGIAWTERTQNFWRGCRKVSAGCKLCYMFTEQRRYGLDPTEVVRTKTWGAPRKWDREALAAGRRFLVFTCSWSDFFIEEADPWRADAWKVIRDTPNLVYQVLTKRPERVAAHLPPDWGATGYDNVWLGATVEDNAHVGRLDYLRAVPAAVRFVSAEPLLGPLPDLDLAGIHWVITGGESGDGYRPMDPAWALAVRDRCRAAGAAFFHKQAAGPRAGMDPTLGGVRYEEFPAAVAYRRPPTPLPML